MKLTILATLLGIAFASQEWKQDRVYDFGAVDLKSNFEDWKVTFNKNYDNVLEESHRFIVFLDNWKKANDHNIHSNTNYTLGLNQFGDLTVDEFQYYVHGHKESCLQSGPDRKVLSVVDDTVDVSDNPTSIDWTNYNGKSYVTPVKNQGQCGSCWAFSTTGSLESRTAISKQQTGSSIVTLSEQQLVDCSKAEGNQGCNGGLMDNAFKYVQKEGGLCSESEYKYTARDGSCKATTCGTKYDPISGYTDVKSDSEPSLETAVAAGPVSIAVDASGTTWQLYKSGIVDGKCGTRLDHGVLAVGYGADSKGEKYWKVKNSWGTTWGEKGYILICKECNKNGNKGECGIVEQPSYPLPK